MSRHLPYRMFLDPIEQRRVVVRFGLAIFLPLVAVLIALQFPNYAHRPAYSLFLASVTIATWYGGWAPGLLSLLLGAGLSYSLFLPQEARTADSWWYFAGYLGTAALICGVITLLDRRSKALRRAQLRFGGVVQISEDAIITTDEEQRITLFNPGASAIFGYSADEVLGRPVHILLPERFRAAHEKHMQSFAHGQDSLRAMNERGLIYGLRKDGSEFPAEASISKFQAGREKIMTVRLRDVTERQLAEHGMRHLAAIVESSSDAILSLDLNGKITSWNAGAEKMYGFTAAEVIGRRNESMVPNDRREDLGRILPAITNGKSIHLETVHLTKDKRRIDVAITISPIRDKSGKPVGASAVSRDITERRRLEEQLRQSQKMEAIGRLAGGVAHDFNNLLNVIVGYTYLIQSSTPQGDSLRNAADQVMSAAERATSLTRQLLAFSRKQVVQPEVMDLNDVLGSMGKMLPRLIGEDIDLRVAAGKGVKSIKADPGQIEQVVMNLVVNARDAMPEGGRITIETANCHFDEIEARYHGVQPGAYVVLAVTDTGQGMDEETRTHIFEPFFTTKEAGKGTGLGLATVYAIVSQSGGHIWVYSEPGHGTTFKIYFPATETEAIKPRVVRAPELSVRGSETILLVEDEDVLRKLLVKVLEEKGYTVLSAANGAEARSLAESHNGPIDLMLTDVILPQVRGHQLAEWMRASYPNMLVVYMSGYTDTSLVHGGQLTEGAVLLQKPFTPDFVLRKVREVLDAAQGGKAVRRKAG